MPAALVERYRREGLVGDATVGLLLPTRARRRADRPALTEDDRTLTYAALLDAVSRMAGRLARAGIGPGDIVTWQAPNWWEAQVAALAIWHLGAIGNPVVPFFREHELRHILGELRPAAVICAGSVKGHSSAEMTADVLAELGLDPKISIVLRGEQPGWVTADEALAHEPLAEPAIAAPDDPCLVLYTSGTTAQPKGVLHTSRSLLAETAQIRDEWGLGWEDVGYMPAPLPHITGMLVGVTVPLSVGAHSVLADRWDADRAAAEAVRHGVTFSAGATVFLRELAEATRFSRHGAPSWRIYACGGAPVPRAVMEDAEAAGIPATRVYGMTELPTVTLGDRTVSLDRRAGSDGVVAAGVEVRTLDEDGLLLPAGTEGELVVRGPERFAGYVGRDAESSILPDGWFRTGDIGRCDEHGDLTITGRLKDIVNRGGEKFSTREIEDLLLGHPRLRQAAVLPAADVRLGETPAAFVVIDGELDADALTRYLLATGLPARKLPTRWIPLDDLPSTSTGKIRKNELAALLENTARPTRKPATGT